MRFGNKLSKIYLNKFLFSLRDLLFPVRCIGCQEEGEWLCQPCANTITINLKLRCPVCGQSSFYGRSCKNCQSLSKLTGLWAVSFYKCELLKRLIHHYKYIGLKGLAQPLAELMIKYLDQLKNDQPDFFKKVDLLIPVPLHRRRFLQRGYNQVQLLAQILSNHFGWNLLGDCLVRVKFTSSQVGLKEKLRKVNISGAFKIIDARQIKGKNIILIDDVITTGSTLQECAKILKEAGAEEVWGLALAQD